MIKYNSFKHKVAQRKKGLIIEVLHSLKDKIGGVIIMNPYTYTHINYFTNIDIEKKTI